MLIYCRSRENLAKYKTSDRITWTPERYLVRVWFVRLWNDSQERPKYYNYKLWLLIFFLFIIERLVLRSTLAKIINDYIYKFKTNIRIAQNFKVDAIYWFFFLHVILFQNLVPCFLFQINFLLGYIFANMKTDPL